MLHGTGSDKNEAGGAYVLAARAMAKADIATIRIDFMGNGESTASYSDYSYTSAKLDAKAAAGYLGKQDGVDAAKLGVMGWSQGGTDALLAAAAYPDTFKAVVTWAGAPSLTGTSIFAEGFDTACAAAKKDGGYTMKLDWRGDLTLGVRWFDEVKSTDVLREAAEIKAPVLAINGSLDTVVPMDNAAAIRKAAPLGSEWIVDGADHTFNIFTGDQSAIHSAIDVTSSFFHKALAEGYVEITRGVANGERIVPAVISLPTAGNGPFPGVVMNHGHGGSKDENTGFVGVARALARDGVASIRMDFPGCGASTAPFTDNTLTNMISDSNACRDYLLKNYFVDKNSLGVLGYSMGGRIALTILGQKENPYKAAVLLSASADPGEEMAIRLLGGQEVYQAAHATAAKEGFFPFTTQYGQEQNLSNAWFDDMKASEPLKNIAGYTGPMLVMYGDKDVVVDEAVNQSIIKAYSKAEAVVTAGADHGYGFYSDQSEVTAEVEDGITKFINANLGGKSAQADKAA